MRFSKGTVVAGKVVLDGSALADGTDVLVLAPMTAAQPGLAADERAELDAGIAEADRGDLISGRDFFDLLRKYG
jgi:hypothetical protein